MRVDLILLLVAGLAPGLEGRISAGRTAIAESSPRPVSMAFQHGEPRVLLQGTVLFLAWSLERDADDGPVWITLRDFSHAHVLFEWSVDE